MDRQDEIEALVLEAERHVDWGEPEAREILRQYQKELDAIVEYQDDMYKDLERYKNELSSLRKR